MWTGFTKCRMQDFCSDPDWFSCCPSLKEGSCLVQVTMSFPTSSETEKSRCMGNDNHNYIWHWNISKLSHMGTQNILVTCSPGKFHQHALCLNSKDQVSTYIWKYSCSQYGSYYYFLLVFPALDITSHVFLTLLEFVPTRFPCLYCGNSGLIHP